VIRLSTLISISQNDIYSYLHSRKVWMNCAKLARIGSNRQEHNPRVQCPSHLWIRVPERATWAESPLNGLTLGELHRNCLRLSQLTGSHKTVFQLRFRSQYIYQNRPVIESPGSCSLNLLPGFPACAGSGTYRIYLIPYKLIHNKEKALTGPPHGFGQSMDGSLRLA
jgi:hypothetical protein